MTNITKIENLPEKEEVYLKKGWDGYRVVYPVKKDVNLPFQKGNINWNNLLTGGHWSVMFKGLLFLLALYFFVQMYLSDTKQCREFVQDIELVCSQYTSTLANITQNNDGSINSINNLNFSKLKLNEKPNDV